MKEHKGYWLLCGPGGGGVRGIVASWVYCGLPFLVSPIGHAERW